MSCFPQGAAINRALLLALLTILFLPAAQAAQKTVANRSAVEPGHPQQINRGDLVGNMQLLNLWGERPAPVQRLYEAAYRVLATRPDATFADLARDAGDVLYELTLTQSQLTPPEQKAAAK